MSPSALSSAVQSQEGLWLASFACTCHTLGAETQAKSLWSQGTLIRELLGELAGAGQVAGQQAQQQGGCDGQAGSGPPQYVR